MNIGNKGYIYVAPGKREINIWLDKRIGWGAGLAIVGGLILIGVGGLVQLPVREVVLIGFGLLYVLITVQALVTLYWTIFAWNDPEAVEQNRAPKIYEEPKFTFTALLPARHEEKVIGETIGAMTRINYPDEMKELVVLIRDDDVGTIKAAEAAIGKWKATNMRVVVVPDRPLANKPYQLNWGLREAKNDVVAVFDAEDSPSAEIYQIANTVMSQKKVEVVQAGVQLMNLNSNWYSLFNVLEYYFWFKSALHFFAKCGVVPLGGNTVFFKRTWLNQVGGWNEQCLTEDAEIGMRLTQAGAKVAIVYDQLHSTQEETPPTLSAFIKQRTRWHMGYLQIFRSGIWTKFKHPLQIGLAGYILILPELVLGLGIISPLVTWWAKANGLPMGLTLLSFLPAGLIVMQMVVLQIGLWQFIRDYRLRYRLVNPIKLALGYGPFMAVLAVAAVRAVWRLAVGNLGWEKTGHINAHRIGVV